MAADAYQLYCVKAVVENLSLLGAGFKAEGIGVQPAALPCIRSCPRTVTF